MSIIFGHSKDPILIKKIPLKIWYLRHEIEAVLREKLMHEEGKSENEHINDLIEEYVNTPVSNVIPIHQGDEAEVINIGEGQEAMAAALADEGDVSDGEEAKTIAEAGDADIAKGEDTMAAAIAESAETTSQTQNTTGDEPTIIKQRRPNVPEELIIHAKTLLAEVNMETMHLFCDENFLIGNTVIVEFLVPNKFSISANVVHCREYSMKSRIISQAKLRYRAIFKFAFLKEGEKTLLRQFLNSVEPEKAAVQKKATKKVENNDDDEGFDELDDLDL